MTNKELVGDLGHQNLAVRLLATMQLIDRARSQADVIDLASAKKDENRWRAAHAVWVHATNPKTTSTPGAPSDHTLFQVHLLRVMETLRAGDYTIKGYAPGMLADEDPRVRRAALELVAAHPAPTSIRPLLDAIHRIAPNDTHLRHAARVALREQLRDPKVWSELPKLSDTDARAIADVSVAIPANESATFLSDHIQNNMADQGRLPDFLQHIARYGDKDIVAKLPALLTEKLPQAVPQQATYLLAIQRGMQQRGEALSPELVKLAEAVAKRGLEGNDASVFQPSIELASALRLATLFEPLVQFARLSDRPEPQRGSALQALGAINAGNATPLLGKLLVDAAQPIGLREKAAQVLAAINQPAAQAELVNALATAEARLATAIASGLAGSRRGAEQLLDAVEKGKASARLLQDKQVHQRLIESKLPKAAERVASLTKGLPSADQKIESLMKQRRQGFQSAKADSQTGLQIYTKNCAICHQINSQGAKIGPQLDGIGGRGLDRLLEDILDPNRNVDQAMRQTTFNLKDGGVVAGLVLREEGQVIVVADQQGKEVRVEKDNIDNRRTSMLSPMPANLGETIPEKDFYDLLAYLLTQRPKEK
jgi:putative heme-binding domain-containing protein